MNKNIKMKKETVKHIELKQSPFLHVVSLDDNYVALYNSLNLEIAFVGKNFISKAKKDTMWHSFDVDSKNTLELFKMLGLLIDKHEDGYAQYKKYQEILEEPAINILYLLLSDACNIRCRYCYFLSSMPSDYKFSFMKKKTAIKAIDLFARCVKKSIAKEHKEQHIIIYGGEPTLNKSVLLDSLNYIDYLKEKEVLPESVSVTLNTNGILLDREILSQCRTSGTIVSISIDGPKDINDQMRVYSSGKGTFDEIISPYKLAQQMGVKTGICVTIDQHNLFRMEEIIDWVATELNAKGMGFNVLIENRSDLMINAENRYNFYSNAVAKGLIESFKVARDKGIYEDRMMRRVNSFINKETVLSDCGGCGLQIVISPDGKIGVCQAFCGGKKFFVTEPLESFNPEDHPFWRQWRRRSPLNNEICKKCIALGNCGGGCPYNAYRLKGTINAIDESFCPHAIATTNFLIRDLWSKHKEGIQKK